MNFLIDANLPRRLVFLIRERGHQAIQTIELASQQAIFVTLNLKHFLVQISALTDNCFVELTREHIIVHA